MSLAFTNLKPVKVVDPRVNISEAKNYLFKQGGNVVTHRTYTSTSSNDSSTTFKCNPPNPNSVISRLVYLTMRVEFKITAVSKAADGVTDVNADLRSLFGFNVDGVAGANNSRNMPKTISISISYAIAKT